MCYQKGIKRTSVFVGIILGFLMGLLFADDAPGAPWHINIYICLLSFIIPFVITFAFVQLMGKFLRWIVAGFLE